MGASSRYRFYQFLPKLEKQVFECKVSFLLSDFYLENLYKGNRLRSFLTIVFGYFKRLFIYLFSRKFDFIWLENELLPWMPAFFETSLLRFGPPYIVDYDDAIFHRYDQHRFVFIRKLFGKKIDRIMSGAAIVIAGNHYIADYAKRAGAGFVKVIPTVLDIGKYNKTCQKRNVRFTIGWIGSPSTSPHLRVVQPVLDKICRDDGVRFKTIGAHANYLGDIPVSAIPWSEETEVNDLKSFDVGIMPLPDTPWERGKCGFKLIQYMAAGIPVIASPVGVNNEIVDHGVNGFLAADTEEWIEYLELLKENSDLGQKMGEAGRKKVEKNYSLDAIAPELKKILLTRARV